jgi:hypothetical protein
MKMEYCRRKLEALHYKIKLEFQGSTGFLDFVHRPVFWKLENNVSEYRTMDKVKKPSNSECYTPSLKTFRIYWHF